MDPTLTRKTFLSRIGQARLCLGEASDYATGLLLACADDETPNVLASIITAFSALSGQLELSQRELEDSGDVQILKQLTPVLNNYRHLFRRVDESISLILAAYEAQPECFVSRSGPMDKVKSLYVQFIADEGEYLRGLDTLVNVFCARLTADEALSKSDENTIFSLFPELLEAHKKFLKDLKVCLRSYPDVGLGSIVTSTLPLLQKYTAFSVNSSASAACLERVLKESKSLASLLKSIEKEKGLSLKTLLTRPLTRLEEYLQFLEEYRKTISPVAPDFSPTEEAIDGLQEIIDTIEQRGNVADNLSRLMDIGDSIQGLGQNLVQPDRRFIHGGQLSITPEGQKKPSADYVFMFNDMLLYCQTTGKERLYVGQIWMHTLSVQPIVAAGDSNASPTSFTIVDGKNKYTATTSSEDQTKNWIFYIGKAIREVERTRKVFGVPLKVLMRRETDSDIPMIVDKVVHFIYDYGINKEGLFRQTGRSTQIEKLKDQLNQGKKVFFSENMDVHSVADLFKHWLRELPDPLLTWQAYPKCSAALEKNVGNPEQLVQDLAQIVDGMPRANKYVTQHLLKCLKAICDNEVKTKMNPGNLAVVFASNILRNGDPNANPFDMKYFETVNEIFKTFIVNYDQIFGPIEAKRFKISKRADRKSATVSSSSNPLSVTVAPPSPSAPSVSLSSSSPPASSSVPLRDRERRKSSSSFHRASVLRASSDSSDSIKSGVMTVHNKKKWSTRFCVLQQGSITLYKGHKERRATARLLLIGHQVTPMDSRPFSFTVELPDGSKTNFSCKSAEEQDVWMTCIREASSINIPLLSPKSPKSLF